MRDTYVRFLKAASLASALSLDANEIGYLGYAPSRGRGWLNLLPASPYADPLGSAYLGGGDGARLRATLQIAASHESDQAGIAPRTASYQRRADEWMHRVNLAARDLMAIGRQIIGSLIAEQAAFHDYQNVQTQIKQAQDIQSFLQNRFTNAQFYDWMGSELSALYDQYYRFACDTARRAEQTMKRELMRPELDETQFIQCNYWDSGHQGLLSGEALHFDLKRLEMAYHDNNKRELEMTRHVSLRQLDPMALIQFRVTGTCTVTVPEWLYHRDCAGHYMRRIKSVAMSIPSVVGPYASVNCTLSLQARSALLANGVYGHDPTQDDIRFVDYCGATDVVVTSGASNDSGMFETNLHDERFLRSKAPARPAHGP